MTPSSSKSDIPFRPEPRAVQARRATPRRTQAHRAIPDLRIATTESTACTLCALILHALAACAMFIPQGLPLPVSLLALLPLSFNAGLMLRQIRLRRIVIWYGNNRIEVHSPSAADQRSSGTVSQRSMQCYFFVLLEISGAGRRRQRILIARDAVPVADYRRLRARIYLSARTSGAQSPE